MNNTQEIKFKSNKISLIVGLFMLLLAVICEVAFIQGLLGKGRDETILLISGSIFITGSLVFLGISDIGGYFHTNKSLQNALKLYGEENVIINIRDCANKVYQDPLFGGTTYFTDKLVVNPKVAIIDYNEISLMYKQISSGKIKTISLVFVLLSGRTCSLGNCISDEEIMNVMQLCYQHNPKILFGLTKENRKIHKQRVQGYKAGSIKVPLLSLEPTVPNENKRTKGEVKEYIFQNFVPEQREAAIHYYQENTGADAIEASNAVINIFEERERKGMVLTTPREWTEAGRKYEMGRLLVFIGIYMLVSYIISTVAVPLSLNKDLDEQINVISQKEREELLDAGCLEYRTVGTYFEKDASYGFRNEELSISERMMDLYLFELENQKEPYLAIKSQNDWKYYNEEMCAGFDIFYNGEITEEAVIVGNNTYTVEMIKASDIVSIHGIASKELQKQRLYNFLLPQTILIWLSVIALVLIVVGQKTKKKYKKKYSTKNAENN